MTKQQTYDYVWFYLVGNDRAVEQAILELYRQQTKDEQINWKTRHANKSGFSSAHAKHGSYYAALLLKGQRLNSEQLSNARKISLHYVKQLAPIFSKVGVVPYQQAS